MYNRKSPIIIPIIILAVVWGQGLAGNGYSSTIAGDQPAVLEQDGSGANLPPSDVTPDASPQNETPRKQKAPGASGDLTPFKPSEEIEAGQAVDFPYDI